MKRMNKQGLSSFGTILLLFMGIIIVTSLIVAIAQSKGQMTDLKSVANESLGTLTNGTTLYITAYKSCSDFKVFNATGDEEVASSNYTVTNNVVYNGQEAVSVSPQVTAGYASAWNKGTATFDGTCQPLTYIPDSSGRTIANLIVIFAVLGLLGWVVYLVWPQIEDAFNF
jgi:predicted PurR-regulated permease PerM